MELKDVNAIGVKFNEKSEEEVFVNLRYTTQAYGQTYYHFVKMVVAPTFNDRWAISQKYFDEQVANGSIRVIQTFGELAG